MVVDKDNFLNRNSEHFENTPLLYPPIKPIFSYNNDKGNPDHIEYEVNDQNEKLLKPKAKLSGRSNGYFGILLAFCASILLSLTTLIAKVLIEYHPFNEAMWRFQGILLPSIPILIWSKVVKKEDVFESVYPFWKPDKRKIVLMLFLRAFCGCTAVIFQFYALSYIEIGDVTTISFATPIGVSILAYFMLGEKLGITQIFTALLTLLGVAIISRPPFLLGTTEFDVQNLIGVGLALGCMLFATFTYVALRWLRPVHYAVVTSFYGFFSVTECFIFAVIAGALEFPQTAEHWMLAFALGGIAFLGQSLFTLALKYEDAGPVALVRTSEVIFTFAWQIIFLGELPDISSLLGAFMILLSVVLTTIRKWISELPEDSPTRNKFAIFLK